MAAELTGDRRQKEETLGNYQEAIEKAQAEIDILGEQDKTTALFGECKWTNERVDLGVLETLVHRSHLFQHSKVYCFLFSKSGFTKGCMERATELGNVTLVEYADILEYYEV